MLVLGIDTGSKNLGFALYDTEKEHLLYYQEWNPKSYKELYQTFINFLTEHEVSVVVMEEPFYSPVTMRNAVKVLESIGILKLGCNMQSLRYEMISPREMKKLFTGSGNALKEDIQAKVTEEFGLTIKSTHVNDAIGICMAWLTKQEIYEQNN